MSNRTISTMFSTSTTTSIHDATRAINGDTARAVAKPHSDVNAFVAALVNAQDNAQGAGESAMLTSPGIGPSARSQQPVSEPGRSACGAPVLIE